MHDGRSSAALTPTDRIYNAVFSIEKFVHPNLNQHSSDEEISYRGPDPKTGQLLSLALSRMVVVQSDGLLLERPYIVACDSGMWRGYCSAPDEGVAYYKSLDGAPILDYGQRVAEMVLMVEALDELIHENPQQYEVTRGSLRRVAG